MKPNEDVRLLIRQSGFPGWQVALKMNISEQTLYRWLRRELTASERKQISDVLKKLKRERADEYLKAIAE